MDGHKRKLILGDELIVAIQTVNINNSTSLNIQTQISENQQQLELNTMIPTASTPATTPVNLNQSQISENAQQSRLNTINNRIKKRKELLNERLLMRQLKGYKETSIYYKEPERREKEHLYYELIDRKKHLTAAKFRDFTGFYDKFDETFEPSHDYWRIPKYRNYHINILAETGTMTKSMKLRLRDFKLEIQLIDKKYRCMFKDSLRLDILRKQVDLWKSTPQDKRHTLSFFE